MPGPYELYLIRHGLAEERGDAWPDDTKRPLTDEGMSRVRKAARGLARLGVLVEVVLSSPLVRARQTAEIVAGGLDPRPSLVNADSLAPDGTYAAVVADLEKHARKTRIALVGHAPPDRVQEGRGVPHRRRQPAAGRSRRSALDAHAEDPPRPEKVNRLQP
jgi:phosphohistidine phosphatase SixA